MKTSTFTVALLKCMKTAPNITAVNNVKLNKSILDLLLENTRQNHNKQTSSELNYCLFIAFYRVFYAYNKNNLSLA